MSRIQISNTLVGYCWCVVKPFIAVLVLYSSGAVVLWGAPYIGWVRMCMGLAMAGACAKHRPCYWSQTFSHLLIERRCEQKMKEKLESVSFSEQIKEFNVNLSKISKFEGKNSPLHL